MKTNSYLLRSSAILVVLLANAAIAERASAQQAPAAPAVQTTEEVVVTARRRTERLQDVPVSVTAFSQKKLDTQGVRSIDDLVRISPGVEFSRNGSGASANYNDENSDVSLRGVDSTAGSSTTGIYIDDTPIQTRHLAYGTVNPFPALFDLSSVEVLRGPQGTLFGAGSEGGTIRFVSPEPSLTAASRYVRAEVSAIDHGGDSYNIGAALGGPIVEDKVGFRASLSTQQDGGWVDRENPATGVVTDANANWQSTQTARLAVKFAVTDTLTVTPSIYYQKLYINDTAAYWPSQSNLANGQFRNGNVLRDTSTDPFFIASIKAEWKLPFADATFVSSYFHRDQGAQTDYTQYDRTLFSGTSPTVVAGDAAPAYFKDEQRNFVEELKLNSNTDGSRLKWTAGFFYSHSWENTPETAFDPTLNAELGPFTSPAFPANGQVYNQPVFEVTDSQYALFGEANYKITDKLTATAGLRASLIQSSGQFAGGGVIIFSGMQTSSGSLHETAVTPRFILNYALTHDNLLYASATEGFRPGGVNFTPANSCATSQPAYQSDSLWSYEVGTKNSFNDSHIQLNASAFYIDWKNIQQNVYFPLCDFQQTLNLGGVTSKGFEIEGRIRPVEALTLGLTAGYVDAQYNQTIAVVSKGDHIAGAPLHLSLTGDYTLPEWNQMRPYLHLDYQYASAQAGMTPNSNPADALADPTVPQLPTYGVLNARLGATRNGIDYSLFGTNLMDSHPTLFESRDLPGSTDNLYFARTLKPRTVGLTITYRY